MLTFNVGEKKFAIDTEHIRELVRLVMIQQVPKSPEFIQGIINYRGELIPVMDMSMILGIEPSENILKKKIIIFESEKLLSGVIVDDVIDMIDVDPAAIENTLEELADYEFLLGIFNYGGEIYLQVDFNSLLKKERLSRLKRFSKELPSFKNEKPREKHRKKTRKNGEKTGQTRKREKGIHRGTRKRTSKKSKGTRRRS